MPMALPTTVVSALDTPVDTRYIMIAKFIMTTWDARILTDTNEQTMVESSKLHHSTRPSNSAGRATLRYRDQFLKS